MMTLSFSFPVSSAVSSRNTGASPGWLVCFGVYAFPLAVTSFSVVFFSIVTLYCYIFRCNVTAIVLF